MRKRKKLNNHDIIFAQKLVLLVNEFEGDFRVHKNGYIVDAASILGLLSLSGMDDAEIEFDENSDFEFKLDKLIKEYEN